MYIGLLFGVVFVIVFVCMQISKFLFCALTFSEPIFFSIFVLMVKLDKESFGDGPEA